MTHRERVLRTFRFEDTDRTPYDLMEGTVWPELMEYFSTKYGHQESDEVLDFLDTDFRWAFMRCVEPEGSPSPASEESGMGDENRKFSKEVAKGPLADANSIADVEAHDWHDPARGQPPDFEQARRQWPHHALVFCTCWHPLFWSACEAFGVEEALVKMLAQPAVFDAFVRKQHELYMDILSRGLEAARGLCDICWLGDDFSTQQSMFINPDHWRKFIKPRLAEQVRLAREHDMFVLYHSCGAVRPVLSDLIDIGVNGLLVFQTRAKGMDAESIANEFGGRMVFYGGIDIQHTLSYGTAEEVAAEVAANKRAFAPYGGYVVANSHHYVRTIKGENIEAMCGAARECGGG